MLSVMKYLGEKCSVEEYSVEEFGGRVFGGGVRWIRLLLVCRDSLELLLRLYGEEVIRLLTEVG
jgi:hypothetical protein